MMNPFKQRSSIPSSFITGFVGWLGFIFVGTLVFGFRVASELLFLVAIISTIVQVGFLRAGFFMFQMQRHILVGAFWGLISAVALYYATAAFVPELRENSLYWLLIYAYIGAPVGGFLSYFYIDDKKIFDATGGQTPETKFGRDAHWLEPFVFGAVAYVLVYLPFSSVDAFVNVFIVGAVSGVFSAGASHFSPDKWKRSFMLISLIIIVMGSLQGYLTGLLLRAYSDEFYTGHLVLGMGSGVLTYLMTFARGRYLANKEAKGEF